MRLVKEVFLLSSTFPSSELYGLVSQMRRAAIAIPSNIAEGYGRQSTQSYSQFLKIAYGSALELETQLILSKDLEFASDKQTSQVELLLTEIIKMLHVMISKVKSKSLLPNR